MTRSIWIVVALVLILQLSLAAWWLPQKWRVCQQLYPTRPAQIVCLTSR